MRSPFSIQETKEDSAGYNQAGGITATLINLRDTFEASTMENDFNGALESCRAILNVISGKVPYKKVKWVDEKLVYRIEDLIPFALVTHKGNNGTLWITNPEKRKEAKRLIERLYRILEKLQNEYGYGMVSADDPKRAIFKK